MVVGLTGGIGSGKTTVANMFGELGVPVYNSDQEARRLMQSSGKIREAILALMGDEAYKDGEPDRQYIAGRVFGNSELLNRLNGIIHPEVKADFRQWALQQQTPYVMQEAAVLFENGSYKKFDKMVLVTAPEATRIERIIQRDDTSSEAVKARMGHQWDDSRKAALSDFVIENKSLDETRSQVRKIHRQLMETSG